MLGKREGEWELKISGCDGYEHYAANVLCKLLSTFPGGAHRDCALTIFIQQLYPRAVFLNLFVSLVPFRIIVFLMCSIQY